MRNSLLAAGGVAVVVTLLAWWMLPAKTTTISEDGKTINTYGAVSSPDILSPYFSVGGMRHWLARTELNQATTTICSIQSPAGTSTLRFASVSFAVSSTSASIVDIARSVSTGATTTKIGTTYYIAAGAQATIVASTSPQAGDLNIFPPNNYLVVNMKGGATNVFSPTGNCTAEWLQTFY